MKLNENNLEERIRYIIYRYNHAIIDKISIERAIEKIINACRRHFREEAKKKKT